MPRRLVFGNTITFLRPRSPKPKKQDNTFRDARIVQLAEEGIPHGKIAEQFGISRPRVVQICKAAKS